MHNIGNIPSGFSMDVTQESDVFTELSASGELTEEPGESGTLDFSLGVNKEATPGIENFLVTLYPIGQSCDEANSVSDELQPVTVYILPSTGSGIGNSLPVRHAASLHSSRLCCNIWNNFFETLIA